VFYSCYVIYLYITKYSGDQIEKNEMGGACSTYGVEERKDAYRVLVEKPERKKSLRRPRHR